MTVAIVKTAWSGTSGGPGLTQTAFSPTDFGPPTGANAQVAVDAVRAFWQALNTYLPDEILLTVSSTVDYYDQATGALTGSISAATPPATVGGTSTAVYSMAAGMKVNLHTGTIRNGRRVRGGIYVVPASSAVFTTGGIVGSTVRTAVNSAGNTMKNTLNAGGLVLVVWSRPVVDAGGAITRTGAITAVSTIETNEKSAILRGRRD